MSRRCTPRGVTIQAIVTSAIHRKILCDRGNVAGCFRPADGT